MPSLDVLAPPERKSRKLVIAVWASIALAVLLLGLSYIFLPQGLVHVKRQAPYQGTLTVHADIPWETPSGETVNGLVSYDPEAKTVAYLIPPFSKYSSVITPSLLFNNRLLTVRQGESSSDLVIVDLNTQEVIEEIDSVSIDEGSFGQAVWSSDGSRVAYVIYPREGRPYINVSGDGVADDLGFGVPLAFSPRSEEVLFDMKPMLTSVNVSTGEVSILIGAAFDWESETLYASPSGNFLLVTKTGESLARVYAIDWSTHSINVAGVIEVEEGSELVLNTKDQVLVTSQGKSSKVYQFSMDGNHEVVSIFDFDLPEGVRIISWNTP